MHSKGGNSGRSNWGRCPVWMTSRLETGGRRSARPWQPHLAPPLSCRCPPYRATKTATRVRGLGELPVQVSTGGRGTGGRHRGPPWPLRPVLPWICRCPPLQGKASLKNLHLSTYVWIRPTQRKASSPALAAMSSAALPVLVPSLTAQAQQARNVEGNFGCCPQRRQVGPQSW